MYRHSSWKSSWGGPVLSSSVLISADGDDSLLVVPVFPESSAQWIPLLFTSDTFVLAGPKGRPKGGL